MRSNAMPHSRPTMSPKLRKRMQRRLIERSEWVVLGAVSVQRGAHCWQRGVHLNLT